MKFVKRYLCLFFVLLLLLTACSPRDALRDIGERIARRQEQKELAERDARWQEMYELGEDSLAAGVLGEAFDAFMAAIEINPEQLDAYSGLAAVYSAWGDYETAAKILVHQYDAVKDGLQPPWDNTAKKDKAGDTQAGARGTPRVDWSRQYRQLVYDRTYLHYNECEFYKTGDEPDDDYSPITFSLRDIGGDGIPEIIVYNGCDFMASALFYIFTAEEAGVARYVGTAGFRMGAFDFSDNPSYPGLFYQNGSTGIFSGHYYYMEDGALMEEQVLVDEETFADDEIKFVTTQTTSDDALFSEFQNGRKTLPAYTQGEIDAMGWDAFVSETSGQTWN